MKTSIPIPSAKTPVVVAVGAVIIPDPEINVQLPVPTAGLFPDKIAKLAQTVWFGPAFAIVGFVS